MRLAAPHEGTAEWMAIMAMPGRAKGGTATRPEACLRLPTARPRPDTPPKTGDVAAAGDDVVARAVAGDREAFGALYDAHVERVYRFVSFQVGEPGVALDLTQDVFVAAMRGIGRLRQPSRFEPWLLRIARNRVRNHRRDRSRRPAETELPAAPAPLPVDPTADPAVAGERVLSRALLLAAAAGLTEAQREVLALRFVAGLTVDETAAVMGRSADAVKKLQRRGLAAMRDRLDPGEDG